MSLNESGRKQRERRWLDWLLRGRDAASKNVRSKSLAMLQPIWERVVDRAEIGAGDALLEVVAGEGQLGLLGLQRAGRFGSLTLTDISPAVVQHL